MPPSPSGEMRRYLTSGLIPEPITSPPRAPASPASVSTDSDATRISSVRRGDTVGKRCRALRRGARDASAGWSVGPHCRVCHVDRRSCSMCRLFGFRSVIPSQVHRSLLAAENALGAQSNQHPDGWGVAFYVDGSPHVTRNPITAMGDQLFHRLSGVVSSQTVVAHVRKATRGDKTVLNCHPFQYGRWVFAHNGDVPGFERHRLALVDRIAPDLQRFILGETDSDGIV